MASNRETDEENNFGFFDIGLRIFQVRDERQLQYLREEQILESAYCQEYVKAVSKNFECMIRYQMPGEKENAIKELEQASENFPNNLNILGNLAAVHRAKNDITEERKHLTKINEIIRSPMGEVEKARSKVEQGYVMMIDLHSETRDGTEKRVMDLKNQIEESLQFSKGRIERMRNENILAHIVQIQKQLLGAPSDCYKETTQERTLALKKLEMGVELMERNHVRGTIDKAEVIVWKHYLGKAYMRVSGGSNEITSLISKKINVEKAAEIFVEIVNHFENEPSNEQDSILLSRSYAYLIYLCLRKNHLYKESKMTKIRVKGIVVRDNPEKVIEIVIALNDKHPDRVALNKIGIIYTQESKWDQAERVLTKSIQNFPEWNWYAYSWLCYLFLQKHVEKVKDERTKRERNKMESTDLMTAKTFGKQALDMRKTSLTLYRMAKVCSYLGNPEEAIGYLRDALSTHECERHAAMYSLLGSCLYEENKIDDAFQMLKIATTLEPKNQKDPLIYRDFLLLLLRRFRENEKRQRNDKFGRRNELEIICCLLEEGHRKHKMRIKYQTIGALNDYPHEMIEAIFVMTNQELTKRRKVIIDMCIEGFKHHKGNGVKRRCTILEAFYDERLKSPVNEEEAEENEPTTSETTTPQILVGDVKFDYYILFPRSARSWIKNFYIDILGSDINSKEQLLRGRKFKPSDTASSVLKECKKILIVITEDFDNSPVKTLAQELLKQGIDRKGDVIPILKDAERIPDFLQVIEPCDVDDIFRIRNAILSYNIESDSTCTDP